MEKTVKSDSVRTRKARRTPLQIIDRSHFRLLEIRYELESLSFLFNAMGPCDLNGELYGVGVSLQRIYRRIEKITDELAQLPRIQRAHRVEASGSDSINK